MPSSGQGVCGGISLRCFIRSRHDRRFQCPLAGRGSVEESRWRSGAWNRRRVFQCPLAGRGSVELWSLGRSCGFRREFQCPLAGRGSVEPSPLGIKSSAARVSMPSSGQGVCGEEGARPGNLGDGTFQCPLAGRGSVELTRPSFTSFLLSRPFQCPLAGRGSVERSTCSG